AGYVSHGLYRPYLDCRMFSKSLTGFCPVCSRAIERRIDFLTR
ncbi:MAG TPA: peptidase M64, partial [Bacteroidetes bacterium]|nr:peptidase M64 [Bacteroidota bacterium]